MNKPNPVKKAGSSILHSLRTSIAEAPPELKRPAKKILAIAAILFIGISAWKYFRYKHEQSKRAEELAAGPRIRVAKVTRSPGEHGVTVIGETRPFQSVTLYAKVSGYLKDVRVDKGDVVKQGQVLAVIESPETDQEYHAAFADARNRRDIAARTMTLRAKGLVSEQEAEQAQSDADVAAAKLHSQEVQKGYETIRAPFPGTVTSRFADPGALVQNATNSQASALPVVTVSQIRQLRVDVFLDQRDAPFVQKEEPVEITMSERPGFKIQGRVDRLSNELDPRTKMMLTEIDIPNEQKDLVAGSFVNVSLKIKSPPYLEVPVESLILRQTKSFLTVVTPDNRMSFRPIEIAGNDGKSLRIISGINEGEMVALNVGDTIPEGGKVRPIVEPSPVGAPPAGAAAPAPSAAPSGTASPISPPQNGPANSPPAGAGSSSAVPTSSATGAKSP